MPFESSLPALYNEDPNVLVLNEEQMAALEYAEPSPVMLFFSRLGRRLKKALVLSVVAAVIFSYPFVMVTSHKIDDSSIVLSSHQNWSSPRAGVAINTIARELEGGGWVASAPDWHPKARLTAMPAWQTALVSALSDHLEPIAALGGDAGTANADLAAASRLLRPLEGAEMRPRLTAAAQALNRYDGHVARAQASLPNEKDALITEARLFAGWAQVSFQDLATQITAEASSWPASKIDIKTFYEAKARAHVAHEMLLTSVDRKVVSESQAIKSAFDNAKYHWHRAAKMSPIFVSNGSSDATFLGNHLESMAFHLEAARVATLELSKQLETETSLPIAADTPAITDVSYVP